jgi:hypothetical protein
LSVIVIASFLFTAAGCGIFGSDDDDPLSGDISYEMEGEPGTTAFMAHSYAEGLEFHGSTLGSREIPSTGVFSEDLESGSFDAYQVSATPSDPDTEITLRLLSNGNVLDETSELTEEGFLIVEYGEFPDFEW